MKRILTLIIIIIFTSCRVYYPSYVDPNQDFQRPNIQERWWWYQDPIYWGAPAPYYYRIPRQPRVIVVPQPRPQQPRIENNRPYTPQVPRGGNGSNAPIRTFPKPEDKK